MTIREADLTAVLTVSDAAPCPWCGEKVSGDDREDCLSTRVSIKLTCSGCGAIGPGVRTSSAYPETEQMHDAVLGWNTRGRTSSDDWEIAWNNAAPDRDVLGNRE
jgi:hypothetical protein